MDSQPSAPTGSTGSSFPLRSGWAAGDVSSTCGGAGSRSTPAPPPACQAQHQPASPPSLCSLIQYLNLPYPLRSPHLTPPGFVLRGQHPSIHLCLSICVYIPYIHTHTQTVYIYCWYLLMHYAASFLSCWPLLYHNINNCITKVTAK